MEDNLSRRYYWLKLKNDFFHNKEIKKLRKIAGGDTYVIIYLKMQLLSIKQDGIISFDRTEDNIAEQLALELDEEVDNIKVVLLFMETNNLVEKLSEDDFFLTKVPELIGSETDAAERMRKLRERNKVTELEDKRNKVTQDGNKVTSKLQSVTQSKSIEKRVREDIYYIYLPKWNKIACLPTHRESVVKNNISKKHLKILSLHTVEEIESAISDYGKVYGDDLYWYSHRFTFWRFIEKIENFLPDMKPLENYRIHKSSTAKDFDFNTDAIIGDIM